MSFFDHLVDSIFKKKMTKTYETNQEFKNFIDQLQTQKFDFKKLQQFQNLFTEYLYSINQCNVNSAKCLQKVVGYRQKIFFQDNFFFLNLTKCVHQNQLPKNIKKNYLIADFPVAYLNNLFVDVPPSSDKGRIKLMEFMSKFLKNLNLFTKKTGYYLYGPTDSGKTFLSVTFSNRFIAKTNQNVIYINAYKIANYYKNHNGFGQSFAPLFDKLVDVPFLTIDNLGIEVTSVNFRDEFFIPLLIERFNADRPTFLLSTFTPTEIIKHYFFSNLNYEQIKIKNFSNFLKNKFETFKISRFE